MIRAINCDVKEAGVFVASRVLPGLSAVCDNNTIQVSFCATCAM